MKFIAIIALTIMSILPSKAEDGHALWLRMSVNTTPADVSINVKKASPTLQVAQEELRKHWHGSEAVELRRAGNIVLNGNGFSCENDSYAITSSNGSVTITAATDQALLYGAYHLLRMQETGAKAYETSEKPQTAIRILNHWDNPNGTVERGFAGRSIFWPVKYEKATEKKPLGNGKISASQLNIWREYARANASIGINATVLNNVNAKPSMLSKQTINETARIADVLRPYGIRVFLAINFASPKALGDLDTADPLDARVAKWWKDKVNDIYKLIPDFGGFLVKANSEGEPGPMDYDRTHVDGANMLADALSPHHGTVMWRAFVYSPKSKDRASQAYDEFVPFDGQFRNNVIIQIKNGPVDFQPREPISSLFYALKHTNSMPEFQITQEYLGESIHTAFLATMWQEFFYTYHLPYNMGTLPRSEEMTWEAISGVANIGNSRNWCGSDMAQANWYAFGRMAWNTRIEPADIASEWLCQTYTTDDNFVRPMRELLLGSREAVVDYMMPMGIHHIFAGNHHYGPEPWYHVPGIREDWTPRYYHKADEFGMGFDRTKNGSGNAEQYPEPLRTMYAYRELCPENLLLWFHHVGWNEILSNGQNMWTNLCQHYDRGVVAAHQMADTWKNTKQFVDTERYEAQLRLFNRQAKDAIWWRDACLLYFQTFSKQPLPAVSPAPQHKLEDLKRFVIRMDNYSTPDLDILP